MGKRLTSLQSISITDKKESKGKTRIQERLPLDFAPQIFLRMAQITFKKLNNKKIMSTHI